MTLIQYQLTQSSSSQLPPHKSPHLQRGKYMPISTSSPIFTLLIVLLLAVCLFPTLFNLILYTPVYPILYFFPPPPSLSPSSSTPAMSWFQKTLSLPAQSRGSYLITDTVVRELPELKSYKVGILHLFMQHTSAALSLNENWDEDVRADMSDALDRIVPEDRKGDMYRHSCEGSDDMPAHVKSALIGASVTIPIKDGKLATGTWQGVWYLEFRAAKHSRKLVATIQGERA